MPEPPTDLPARRRQVGNHIREHREWGNLTQDELVRRSGLDRRTLQRIERGETDARLTWLMLIADAVGITLAELVEPPAR